MKKSQKILEVCYYSLLVGTIHLSLACLSLLVFFFPHAAASLKSTPHKKTPQKRNLDLRRKLDEVYILKGQCGKANIKPF